MHCHRNFEATNTSLEKLANTLTRRATLPSYWPVLKRDVCVTFSTAPNPIAKYPCHHGWPERSRLNRQRETIMTDFNRLTDDNLDLVTGGMSCQTAIYVAKFWFDVAGVLGALGNTAGAAGAHGRGEGLLDGGCQKT